MYAPEPKYVFMAIICRTEAETGRINNPQEEQKEKAEKFSRPHNEQNSAQ